MTYKLGNFMGQATVLDILFLSSGQSKFLAEKKEK